VVLRMKLNKLASGESSLAAITGTPPRHPGTRYSPENPTSQGVLAHAPSTMVIRAAASPIPGIDRIDHAALAGRFHQEAGLSIGPDTDTYNTRPGAGQMQHEDLRRSIQAIREGRTPHPQTVDLRFDALPDPIQGGGGFSARTGYPLLGHEAYPFVVRAPGGCNLAGAISLSYLNSTKSLSCCQEYYKVYPAYLSTFRLSKSQVQ
jgi:hypothetical protein